MNKDDYLLDSDILSGAMENGRPIYVVGNFGGFGGFLSPYCFLNIEHAKEYIKKVKLSHGGMSIFEVSAKHLMFYSNDGKEIT